MAVRLSRPALRWLVPVSVAALAVGGGAATRAISASADASLPERSAAQLLVDVQQARLDAVSGTVVARADLGLPKLPEIGGQGSANLSALVAGSHTLRVWYAGPDKARVALLGTLGESDIIANGRDLWIWSSDTKSASHRTLPADAMREHPVTPPKGVPIDPSGLPKTPQEAADRALAALDPSTKVSTDGTATVAGRPAYELVLSPRDTTSLVSGVRIAIDGKRHVPLRVQVFARGHADPAAEIGFTQVSFARPDAAQFRFTPPPGTKITEDPGTGSGTAPGTPRPPAADGGTARPGSQGAEPVVLGTGWTTVVAAQQPADLSATPGTAPRRSPEGGATTQPPALGGQLDAVLGALPRVSGSWGSGRLLSSRLFSVLITDDGRVLAGAVSPSRLYAAADDPKALALRTHR